MKKALHRALFATFTATAALPVVAQQDTIELLTEDISQAAVSFKNQLKEESRRRHGRVTLGTRFMIQGINWGCNRIKQTEDSTAHCLNALLGASTQTGKESKRILSTEERAEFENLRQRHQNLSW